MSSAVACQLVPMQLEAMSKTSILITPCGGTGTVLTFLQPGSTAIVFNYWQDLKNISVQMESIYYWFVAAAAVQCDLLQHDVVHCNSRLCCKLLDSLSLRVCWRLSRVLHEFARAVISLRISITTPTIM